MVLAAANYADTVDGYFANKAVHKTNDIILKNAYDTIKGGENIDKVTLYKEIDEEYGNIPVYGADYIVKYMKRYYGLPADLEVEFVDYR